MSVRNGVTVRSETFADGGDLPDPHHPRVTAVVRCFWPRNATEEQIEKVLSDVLTETLEEVRKKRREES